MVDAIEMKATLVIGFSFLKEEYTSRVVLIPSHSITAVLYDEETEHLMEERHADAEGEGYFTSFFKKAKQSAKKSILKNLRCDWRFAEVPQKKNEVEVFFSVSFEFKNPMHSKLIMNNIVVLMTRCFERRCEGLYGPPSVIKQRLPAI
ncbi:hypothetical protein STCU_11435 [Strigomonas culicis]|uniref:Coenzyme Q-binding protein COQ10 START domain-containing protein n=1 Tax=Strigomonas culicis TaxID=28005 RepID=S9TE03_9TRYP|nr:hypothetical protein STCU_11435 [Strigomonas culicis]|eukprot:EPY16267.1 hypothetical protein STCU_11435 [Strigomonas culicis]